MARGRSGRGGSRNRRSSTTTRQYPRTARLNALLQEITAEYFEIADDEELGFFTVTGVAVDSDLNTARVFVSVLDDEASAEADAAFLAALAGHRRALQRAIADQAKLRKTPEVAFEFDSGVRAGARVEAILRDVVAPPDVGQAEDGLLDPDDVRDMTFGDGPDAEDR